MADVFIFFLLAGLPGYRAGGTPNYALILGGELKEN